MNKTVLCVFLAVFAGGGLLFAQNRLGPGMWQGAGNVPVMEKTSVSGALEISRGQLAVKDGEKTCYLMGLDRYIGFIDGLKEGVPAKIEGYGIPAWDSQNDTILRVTKLTLNGKDYDLDAGYGGGWGNRAPGPQGGSMYGYGGYGPGPGYGRHGMMQRGGGYCW